MEIMRTHIGHKKHAEKWLIDNDHIITGYRIRFNSKRKICRSLFMLHNESVNIWTHLFGVFLFVGLMAYTMVYLAPPGIYSPATESVTTKWFQDATTLEQRVGGFYQEKFGNNSPASLRSPTDA